MYKQNKQLLCLYSFSVFYGDVEQTRRTLIDDAGQLLTCFVINDGSDLKRLAV
jgi:hypothetical protein